MYFVRGAAALVWAAAFAAVSGSLGAAAVALLVGYPLIDVVASAVDLRLARPHRVVSLPAVNAACSLLAAVAIGFAGADDVAAVFRVFGGWALVSGTIQVIVAVRRRPALGRQLTMLVSGGLSMVAGVGLAVLAAADHPKLADLIGYAALGGVFFIADAALLAHRGRPNPAR